MYSLDGAETLVPVGATTVDIKARNATDAELDDLIAFAQTHSPVCNTVMRPVPVRVERLQP